MTTDSAREIGEFIAAQLDKLDEDATFICGCPPENLRIEEGVLWAYDRRFGGFHDPRETHPSDEQLAVRYLLANDGDGLGLA